MLKILLTAWNAITSCFKRKLDDEIYDVIDERERKIHERCAARHPVLAATPAPVVVNVVLGGGRRHEISAPFNPRLTI